MRYPIVIQLLIILLLSPRPGFAQNTSVKWGNEIKYDGKEGSYVQLITRSGENTYLLEQKDFEPFKLKFFITKLDKDLNLVSSKELEAKSDKGRDMKFMTAFHTEDKIILFSKMVEKIEHKSMNLVYASLFDLNGNVIGTPKIVDMKEESKDYIFPYVCQSPDKSKYMVMSWTRKGEEEVGAYNIHVFDNSLNLIWGYTDISADADKIYDFKGFTAQGVNSSFDKFKKNIAVDNDGKVYLLMTVKRPKSKYLAAIQYYSTSKGKDVKWDAAQNIPFEFTLKAEKQKLNYYDAHLQTLDNGKVLLCFGFNAGENEEPGAYYMLIDGKANSMQKQFFLYAKDIQNTEAEADGRQKDTRLKYHFLYGGSMPEQSINLVFEANDDQPDRKKPAPGFLLVVNITAAGEIQWHKMIAASQGPVSIKPDKQGKLYIAHSRLAAELDKKTVSALQANGIGKDDDGILKISIIDRQSDLKIQYLNLPNAASISELMPDSKEVLFYRWVAYSMKYSIGLGKLVN